MEVNVELTDLTEFDALLQHFDKDVENEYGDTLRVPIIGKDSVVIKIRL